MQNLWVSKSGDSHSRCTAANRPKFLSVYLAVAAEITMHMSRTLAVIYWVASPKTFARCGRGRQDFQTGARSEEQMALGVPVWARRRCVQRQEGVPRAVHADHSDNPLEITKEVNFPG